ncbi:MAG: sensor histidine kinase [Lachnospiraceae bacterium]
MGKKRSIIWITMLLCCLLILIPVSCSVIYFSSVVSTQLETMARETASFYLDQYSLETSSVCNTLRNCSYYLISDDRTQQIMQQNELPTQLERLEVEEALSQVFLLGNVPNSSILTGIYLVKGGEHYLSVLRNGIYQGTLTRIQQIYDECGSYSSARDLYTSYAYPGYCYFIVDYMEVDTLQPLGKIIIELNASEFINTDNLNTIYQQAVVQLCSTSGDVIAGESDSAFTNLPENSLKGYLDIGNQSYYYTSKVLSPSHLQLNLFIPQQEIFESINSTIKVSIAFTLFILLITLIIGGYLLYLIFKPLRQATDKIDRLAAGDLEVRMEMTPYLETNQISTAFNSMTDRLKELFDEVYTKGLLLRDAEFNLLESQIRPHFIFNILELINMRCLAAGQGNICHIITNLAQLLRSNISHKHEQTIPFEDELRYVRYYLELQKERFEDKLHYSIDLEDNDILKYYLPKLTIQPLVENSIVHGLENKRGGGWIRISIWEDIDAVCIRITDDGIGFEVPAIGQDAANEETGETTHNHIALSNISRRIQLLYGEPYGMTITSSPGQGTDVLLTVPIDKRINIEEEG